MLSEEASTEDSVDTLSEVSCLDDDFARMHFESASSGEDVTDDEMDSNIWSEIKSESDGEFLEDHGLIEQVTSTSEDALTKLNETRHRLDLCQNPLIKSIYWNEIYCDAHLKRYQVQSSTSTLSSLLSISVAKEFKTMETKIQSLKIIDQQTAQLNSNYIQLNSQFCRTIVDFLLAQPLAYHNYEQDEKIPQAEHKQLEMYLYGLENN
ncbi:unnamed protein product, partial [Rotaria sp. Silwood2]